MKKLLLVLKPMYCRFVVAYWRWSLWVEKVRSVPELGSLSARSSSPLSNAEVISSTDLYSAR